MLQDNEKKGSRQAMKEDIITKILDRDNLNEAFKNVKANKGASGIDDLSIEETAEYIKEKKLLLYGNCIIVNINHNQCVE